MPTAEASSLAEGSRECSRHEIGARPGKFPGGAPNFFGRFDRAVVRDRSAGAGFGQRIARGVDAATSLQADRAPAKKPQYPQA